MCGAVLQFPNERTKCAAAQYERLFVALKHHINRDVGEGQARVWAKAYIISDDPTWEPPYPTPPSDKTDVKGMAIHKSRSKAFEDAIGAEWSAAKIEIWSIIYGQCSPKLRSHLQQLAFFEKAEADCDCITLLRNCNVLQGGGWILSFEPQARAGNLLDLVHFR